MNPLLDWRPPTLSEVKRDKNEWLSSQGFGENFLNENSVAKDFKLQTVIRYL
jgi:hypothetical protein